MAECIFDLSKDLEIEIPPRHSLSSKKYYCHLCRRNTPVIEEDVRCSICQSQFVEEVTPETDLDDFRRLNNEPSQSSALNHHATIDESSEPSNSHSNEESTDDSIDSIDWPILRSYEMDPSVARHLNRYQRLTGLSLRPMPNRSSNNAGEVAEEAANEVAEAAAAASVVEVVPAAVPGLHRQFEEVFGPTSSAENSEGESDEFDDIDIETVSMQDSLSSLIRRTIRRTILDFEQRNNIPHDIRSQFENVSERDPEHPGGRDRVLPLIAEISENINPRGFQDLFHLASNLGDYAFGGEWDTIISQMLNEAIPNGSPLHSKQIDTIPRIAIEEADVLNSLQCTICLEDFQLSEMVKNLPCTHSFHDDCIVPWLLLHDTCPICRKKINLEEKLD